MKELAYRFGPRAYMAAAVLNWRWTVDTGPIYVAPPPERAAGQVIDQGNIGSSIGHTVTGMAERLRKRLGFHCPEDDERPPDELLSRFERQQEYRHAYGGAV